MKNKLTLLTVVLLLIASNLLNAQVSGSVYRDFNGNGIRDTYEPLISGVTVNVYGTSGTLCGTTTSSGNTAPNYTIPSACSGSVRVEFVMPSAVGGCSQTGADFSALSGSTYGTSTQFVTAPASLVNYALYAPGDYNNGTAEVFHNVIYPSNYSTNTASSYDFTGNNYYDANVANIGYDHTYDENNTFRGSNWGLAYSRQAKVVFSAAALVRGAMLGSLGTGGIYKMTPSTSSSLVTASPFFNMDNNSLTALSRTRATVADSTMFPYGEGSSYTLWNINNTNTWARGVTFPGGNLDPLSGSPVTMGVVGSNADRLPNTNASYSNFDPAAFDQVGKVGIGGLAISDDGLYLFVVNLFQKKIFRLTLDNAYNPQSVVAISSYNLPNIVANNGVLRPWAIKYYRGSLYVGAVATGENNGVNVVNGASDLFSYVLELPNATSATLSASPAYNTVLTVPMNYDRGASYQGGGTRMWLPWQYNITGLWDMGHGNAMPQPILSAIDFSDNGDLVLGYLDRARIQLAVGGAYYLSTQSGDGAFASFGETLIAGKNCNGTYGLESNGKYTSANGQNITNAGYNVGLGVGDNRGVGGGQFFTGDYYNGGVSETSLGSLGILKGQGQIIEDNRFALVQTGNGSMGTKRISTITGSSLQSPNGTAIGYNEIGPNTVPGSKQGALTDIAMVLATPEAPIEIGNRVWNDVNANGIQDPGEAGIGGVVVNLYAADGTTLIGSVTTAADGTYYFTNATGTNAPGVTYFNGATTATTGLIENTNYVLKIGGSSWAGGTGVGALAGTPYLTSANSTPIAGVQDQIDNDATLQSNTPTIALKTGISGQSDHSLDFGFIVAPPCTKPNAGADAAICLTATTNTVTLSGTNPTTGTWSALSTNPAGATIASSVVTFTNTGTYSFIYSNGSCTDTMSVVVAGNCLASLGDKVWRDDNKDGIQTAGEPGVSGVTVTLYDNTGKIVGTTVTDAYGNYLFDKLTPGDYTVGFTLPSNYTFAPSTGTSETDATNSDVNVTTGKTTTVTLSGGENQRNVDAGIIFTAPPVTQSVGDRVWMDTNGDGLQTAGEPGVSGVVVTLKDASGNIVATTLTDASGNYKFTNVPVGTYTVKFEAPIGTSFTSKTGNITGTNNSDANQVTGNTSTFNVTAGTDVTYVDAGIVPQTTSVASIGDKVWNDINHDGIQDANEPGIANVLVTLYAADGVTVVGSTTTDAYGNYSFTNLPPATYVLGFTSPSGYTISPKDAGTDDTKDSDINPATGKTIGVTLAGGQTNSTVDAGMYKTTPAGTLQLGDKVWYDQNKDGIQTAGEPGMAGVTVTLYQNGPDGLPGTADDVKIGTTSTDANGKYLFTDLAATTGASTNYTVQFSNVPSGYAFTSQNIGSSTSDSDPNASTGRTDNIDLFANDLTIDAGLIQGVPSGKGSIGDRVWVDLGTTPNGIQDANEPGMAGVTVKLYKDANNDGILSGSELTPVATTTTDALGNYIFGGLDAGTYQVGFSNLPAGYTLTTKSGSITDPTNSDGNPTGTSIAGNPGVAGTSFTNLLPLGQGEIITTVDLGIKAPALTNTLGDYVWYDANSDGVQDATESGVKGVMVTLYDASGTAVGSTTTDENGHYLFTGLANGTYSVGFSNLPSGFSFTTQSPSNDLAGSDANVTTGKTTTVVLGASNRNDLSLDAGLVTTTRAALGNYVWMDTNGDGLQTAGEPGISGVTVSLYRPGVGLDGIAGNADDALPVATSITDANGKYMFGNLVPGDYQVGFTTIPSGLDFTKQLNPGDNQDNTNSDVDPATALSMIVTLSAGETDLTVDAGLVAKGTASVGDYVWNDADGDGLQGANEKGIPGVIVYLYDNAGNVIGSAVTDANGKYTITNVPAGTGYTLGFVKPSNITAGTFTTQGASTGTNNSKADATGKTTGFTVLPGATITNMDAGIKIPGVLAVNYVSFTANKVNNTSALNFVIGKSALGSIFTIERSTDGINFSSIGTLNGTSAMSYNYTDMLPVNNAKNYYRIKEVDAQGKITYSEIRIVKYTKDGKVDIYPIPASTSINISFSSDAVIGKPIVITIYNAAGQLVMNKNITKANATEVINVSSYANGTYQMQVRSQDAEVITTKQIVIIR